MEPDTNVSDQSIILFEAYKCIKIPVSASEILMSRTWAIIVEPDTNVSESEIDQISFYLKHVSGVKIHGNFSASEMLMSLT